jgi:ABC-type branched-subunit amino acid transport system substrate-binding protein
VESGPVVSELRGWRVELPRRHDGVFRRHSRALRAAVALSLGVLGVGATAVTGNAAGASPATSRPSSAPAGGPSLTSSANPGITSNSVTVGQVDDLTLPIAGLFKGAEDGTRAYFAYINSKGGVNGRKLNLDARDSAYQGGVVANATANIITHDFAMVGGFSLLDSAELPYVDFAHMPDVAYPLDVSLSQSPYVYSPAPNAVNDYAVGFMKYLKKKYPNAIKHVGILWANATPSTAQTEKAFENAMRSQGFKIVYDVSFNDTQFTFLPDVLAMKSKGVKLFYSTEMPDFDAATLAKEMQQESFRPMVIQGAAYSSALIKDAGGAANGMYIEQAYPLYLPGQDAKHVAAAALFDKWMKKASSNADFEIEAVYGWMSAQLFVQALKNAGAHPTRASLLAALDKITSFNAGGMISNSDPAHNIPPQCWVLGQVKGNTVVRVPPSPKSGFVCNPGGTVKTHGFKPESRPSATST